MDQILKGFPMGLIVVYYGNGRGRRQFKYDLTCSSLSLRAGYNASEPMVLIPYKGLGLFSHGHQFQFTH